MMKNEMLFTLSETFLSCVDALMIDTDKLADAMKIPRERIIRIRAGVEYIGPDDFSVFCRTVGITSFEKAIAIGDSNGITDISKT